MLSTTNILTYNNTLVFLNVSKTVAEKLLRTEINILKKNITIHLNLSLNRII